MEESGIKSSDREKVGRYFSEWLDWSQQQYEERQKAPHPGIVKFREKVAKYGRDPSVYKALRRQQRSTSITHYAGSLPSL
ncbi:MAG: hypothetical protein SW833_12810 [Cyanobacteriota bacterium]|nr:hypothetical protein [Cyanobacteriota bacterium]